MSIESNDPQARRPARGARQRNGPSGRQELLTGEVLPPTYPLEQPVYEPAPEEPSLIKNPYVLAGLAVACAIIMAVFVVVLFGGSGGGESSDNNGGNNNGSNVIVSPLTPQPGGGVASKSIATSTVRSGPGSDYLETGTLRAGMDVQVIGRTNDSSWFEIYFPTDSQLKGWVPNSALRVPTESVASIPVVAATPIPRPTVVLPTLPPEPTDTPVITPTQGASPTPAGGPDLTIAALPGSCATGVPLIVVIKNSGTGPAANRRVRITVSTASGVLGVSEQVINLNPNDSTNIATNIPVQAPRTSARIDLIDGTPVDANPGNNMVDCVISGGGGTAVPPPVGTPTPTATRLPSTPTPVATTTP